MEVNKLILISFGALAACSSPSAPDSIDLACWSATPVSDGESGEVEISAFAMTGISGVFWLMSDQCPYDDMKPFYADDIVPSGWAEWRDNFVECAAASERYGCYYRVRLSGRFLAELPDDYTACFKGPYFHVETVQSFVAVEPARYREIFDQAERDWEGEVPSYEPSEACVY